MATRAGDPGREQLLRLAVDEMVHRPLKGAGYRRSGRLWRSKAQGVTRVVDVQRESSGEFVDFVVVPLVHDLGGDGFPTGECLRRLARETKSDREVPADERHGVCDVGWIDSHAPVCRATVIR